MKNIMALAVFLAASGLQGQSGAVGQGRVEGRVVDAGDGQPLPGASISFGEGRGAMANDSGYYVATLPAGDYTALFRFIGYRDLERTVAVGPGKTVILDGKLLPEDNQLDMVVVTAGKFEQRVGEVTQSLSVLPATIIQEKATVNLADALDQVPGVVVIDEDPQIRAGSGFSYGAGSRVMMLADDLPILSGDIGRPNWSFLPIEDVAQVEVIKGASSVLYGSAALSGVINVRTAWPGEEPHTRASMFSGVYDAPGAKDAKWWGPNPPLISGASFFHGHRFKKFDLVVAGNAYADDGYVGPERISPDSLAKDPYRLGTGGYDNRVRFNFATRWRNQKVKGLNYGLNGNVMRSHSTSVFLWDNIHEGLYRPAPSTTTNTVGFQSYLDPYIQYTGSRGTRHSLRGRWYRQQFDNNNDQSNANDLLYGEYQLQQKLDIAGPVVLTLGVVGQQVQSHAVLYSGNPQGDGENTANNAAAYLQVDKKFLEERLMVSAGVRYEHFQVNDLEQAEPVFRAGATYRVFPGTFIRASYGQGFRFPTIGERYITTNVGSLHIYPNPDLQPENSVNSEVGVKQGFKIGGFTGYVDMVAFRQDFNHYVEFTFGQWGAPTMENLFGFGFKSINTGGARITGTEFELAGKGKVGAVELHVLMGYTHTLPVSTTPDEVYAQTRTSVSVTDISYASTSSYVGDHVLKFRVENLFRGDVGATWKRVSCGASVRYNSHVRNIDKAFSQIAQVPVPVNPLRNIGIDEWMETHVTGDWITDVRLGYALTPQVKASFLVNNLSNEVYAIRPMAIEAPRTYRVQLALSL